MGYYYKYIKYKNKYKNLKINKKLKQTGGDNNQSEDFNDIIKMYQNIPETGLYGKNISLEKFIKYCAFFIKMTKNFPDVIDIKKKTMLEKKNLQHTQEYKQLVDKIKSKGSEYQKIGNDFEQNVYNNLLQHISNILNINIDKLTILKNTDLYIKKNIIHTNQSEDFNDINQWNHIGEIDAIIMKGKEIVAIVEIKKAFDDIPDGLFQIKRSHCTISQKNNRDIKLVTDNKELIIDSSYTMSKKLSDISFIVTTLPENALNVQSKIKFILLNLLHIRKNLKNDKLFKKLLIKKQSRDRTTNKTVLRYDKGVLETIDFFKNKQNHIIFF